jgi:hypothetical protein
MQCVKSYCSKCIHNNKVIIIKLEPRNNSVKPAMLPVPIVVLSDTGIRPATIHAQQQRLLVFGRDFCSWVADISVCY